MDDVNRIKFAIAIIAIGALLHLAWPGRPAWVDPVVIGGIMAFIAARLIIVIWQIRRQETGQRRSGVDDET